MQCGDFTVHELSMEPKRVNYDMAVEMGLIHIGDARGESQADTQDQSHDQDTSMAGSHAEGSSPAFAVSEELRCRYSNKKCPYPRTKKRTGGLHAFCEEHRENANRNQRKLDSKKRVERRQHQSILSYYETVQAAHQLDPTLVVTPPPLAPTIGVEPYPQPTGLLEEDVVALVSLFGEPDHAEAAVDHADVYAHYR